MIRKYLFPLLLSTVSIWWAITLMADIFVAPTIFRVIENFFNAGDLAMALFSKVNSLEMVLSTVVLILLVLIHRQNKNLLLLAAGIVCWSFALFYFSFLIPKIVTLAELWKKAEEMGVMGIGDVPDIQQAHQYYHRIYVGMDSVKLLLLSGMMIFGIVRSEKLT